MSESGLARLGWFLLIFGGLCVALMPRRITDEPRPKDPDDTCECRQCYCGDALKRGNCGN